MAVEKQSGRFRSRVGPGGLRLTNQKSGTRVFPLPNEPVGSFSSIEPRASSYHSSRTIGIRFMERQGRSIEKPSWTLSKAYHFGIRKAEGIDETDLLRSRARETRAHPSTSRSLLRHRIAFDQKELVFERERDRASSFQSEGPRRNPFGTKGEEPFRCKRSFSARTCQVPRGACAIDRDR